MTKYHINKNGIPSICKAKDGNCPLGSDNTHFNNLQDAQIYADNENKKQYGLTPELNSKEDEINELMKKRNELAESIEHLNNENGLRRIDYRNWKRYDYC